MSPEHQRTVEAYIAARTWIRDQGMALRKQDDSDWAGGVLYDAVWEHPALGWQLIREIARSTQEGEILEELANGPLHQLLVEHPCVLSDIEAVATTDASVRALLSSIWEEQPLPPEIRARIDRAAQPGQ